MNKEDNEVYFLGKSKPKQHNKTYISIYTHIISYTWNKWMDIL